MSTSPDQHPQDALDAVGALDDLGSMALNAMDATEVVAMDARAVAGVVLWTLRTPGALWF